MDVERIQKLLREFARVRDWEKFHTAKNLAISVSVEASELLEMWQWLPPKRHPPRLRIAEELADILIYILMLADKFGIDLERAITDKIALNEINYPVEKVKGSSEKAIKEKS